MCSNKTPPRYNCDGTLYAKPIYIKFERERKRSGKTVLSDFLEREDTMEHFKLNLIGSNSN